MEEGEIQERGLVEPIWERLIDKSTGREEPDAAIAAFRLYRTLSPASRSLYAVALGIHQESDSKAEQPQRSLVRQVEKWSAHWSWVTRALAWDNEQDRLRREKKQEMLQKAEATQAKLCKLAGQILLAPMRKVVELQLRDETLTDVSDQELSRAAHRVIRVLPEIQARERTLLTPASAGERELEIGKSDSQNWTVLKGVHPVGGVLCEGPNESGGNDGKGSSEEMPAWFDQEWVRQVETETGKPEPSRAFHAFTLYRDLPPARRTLRNVTALLRGASATETAGTERPARRSRRREYVSETVESWSVNWKWKMRARAWDEDQARARRRAKQAEYQQMENDQSRQHEVARRTVQAILTAMAKRIQGGSLFAGENAKLVRSASEGISVITRLQEAEAALWGDEVHYEERQVVQVDGNVFGWADIMCECGHLHSKHDQTVPDPRLMPCTVTGCTCQKFLEPDPEAEAERIVPDRSGLPSNLALSDQS